MSNVQKRIRPYDYWPPPRTQIMKCLPIAFRHQWAATQRQSQYTYDSIKNTNKAITTVHTYIHKWMLTNSLVASASCSASAATSAAYSPTECPITISNSHSDGNRCYKIRILVNNIILKRNGEKKTNLYNLQHGNAMCEQRRLSVCGACQLLL